ncbi:MAG: MFS transporter [Candidatus Doudnabacteria bacterium]|nr:MFS transporter [Candidatus Doudnabacteria bacterium]
MLFEHTPHYFTRRLNREVKELYWHELLVSFSLTLTYIFEPIYLYRLNYSLVEILWFYFFVYCWYAILLMVVPRITSRIGYKHSIFLGSVFYVLYWLALFSIAKFPYLFYFAPILFALQKSFYWPSFNSDIAFASAKTQRGREVGVLLSEVELVSIIGPIIGGAISYLFGFAALFGFGAIMMLTSAFPLFRSPDIYNSHYFSFARFVKILRQYKVNFFAYWGYAEDLMLMSVWPIFIFATVGHVFGVGVVTTIASLLSTIILLSIGRLTDKMQKRPLLQLSTVFYATTWILRFMARTVPYVLAFDTVNRLGKAAVNVPLSSLTYEIAGSKSRDLGFAYTVFYEFALSIGKIFTALAAIIILGYTGNIYYVFILAGFLTLFYGLLRK